MPRDLSDLTLSLPPGGFELERVGLRGHASLFAECLAKRPDRLVPALYEGARRNERRFRDILRGACAVVPAARHVAFAAARSAPRPALVSDRVAHLVMVVPGDAGPAFERTLASLRLQTHRDWVLHVVRDEEAPVGGDDPRIRDRCFRDLGGWCDLVGEGVPFGLLRPGDRLEPEALADLLAALSGGADLAYADEWREDEAVPRLKPGWSHDLALATGFFGRPSLVGAHLAGRLAALPLGGGGEAAAAMEVAIAAAATTAVPVPRVLGHSAADRSAPELRARALAPALAREGIAAEPVVEGGLLDLLWPLPEPAPLASIVIPSRERLDLIERVCRGVLSETAYPHIELVIVDNGSTEPAVLAHYAALARDPRVRIVPYPAPFNFSAMVNAGVAASTGRVVVLLNNDVAVLSPGWLEEMVRQAVRPEVGPVGAKLLYGNGTLQHAGVVVGLGGRAGHILRRRPADTPGRLGRLRVAHEVSAVTAACLAVRREVYDAVGGFDAEAFPVDFNDVDFCLRVGAAGWKSVWTPRAVLAHLESVSRGPSVGEKRLRFEREAGRFVARWREAIRHDPYFHPALSLTTFGEDLE